MSPEVALELALAALKSCRDSGFQVAVAVVDRFGVTQVMLRDRFAGPHTPPTAAGKAWNRAELPDRHQRPGDGDPAGKPAGGAPLVARRGHPGRRHSVQAGGATLGAVGVSGAPGGEADDACAKAGIEAVRDKLEF